VNCAGTFIIFKFRLIFYDLETGNLKGAGFLLNLSIMNKNTMRKTFLSTLFIFITVALFAQFSRTKVAFEEGTGTW